MRPSGKGPRVQSFMLYKDPWALLASSFKNAAGGGTKARPLCCSGLLRYLRYLLTYIHTRTYLSVSLSLALALSLSLSLAISISISISISLHLYPYL